MAFAVLRWGHEQDLQDTWEFIQSLSSALQDPRLKKMNLLQKTLKSVQFV